MKKRMIPLLTFVWLLAFWPLTLAQEPQYLTFWQFTQPQDFQGLKGAINGFTVTQLGPLTRESATIHVHIGIFKTEGFTSPFGSTTIRAVSYYPVDGFPLTITGDAYALYRDVAPTPGLTRQQDILKAAYEAVVALKPKSQYLPDGFDWAGTLRIGTQ